MRIVFMGTDRFAVPALTAIIKENFDLVCVITQPDRPSGRGLKTIPSPIKEVALKNSLTLYQPIRVRDDGFIEGVLRKLKPNMIVVAAFGQILPKAILDLPPLGCINLHPSLLPKYRGAAPIQRAIINGENETGVTVMFMDAGEDTGDIILQEKMEIGISDSSDVLSQKLADLAAQLIIKTLYMARNNDNAKKSLLPRCPQDHSKASHAPKLSKEDGLINWEKSALEIHNLIRGTIPWPGAYITFGRAGQVKIWESKISFSDEQGRMQYAPTEINSERLSAPPGTITAILADKGIVVATGNKGLLITTVQPENKSKMLARDFVNGYRVKVGDIFI